MGCVEIVFSGPLKGRALLGVVLGSGDGLLKMTPPNHTRSWSSVSPIVYNQDPGKARGLPQSDAHWISPVRKEVTVMKVFYRGRHFQRRTGDDVFCETDEILQGIYFLTPENGLG